MRPEQHLRLGKLSLALSGERFHSGREASHLFDAFCRAGEVKLRAPADVGDRYDRRHHALAVANSLKDLERPTEVSERGSHGWCDR